MCTVHCTCCKSFAGCVREVGQCAWPRQSAALGIIASRQELEGGHGQEKKQAEQSASKAQKAKAAAETSATILLFEQGVTA